MKHVCEMLQIIQKKKKKNNLKQINFKFYTYYIEWNTCMKADKF